jgi:succinoglycan biosynthesis transport protein ExoP
MSPNYELLPNNNHNGHEPKLPATVELGAPTFIAASPHSSAWEFLHILRKRKRIIVGVTLLAVAVVGIYSVLATKTYQASGRITVNRENADALGFKDVATVNTDDPDYIVALDTQVDTLLSDTLALATIQKLNLGSNTGFGPPAGESELLERFRKHLEVARLPRSRIIVIRFTARDPHLAAEVVNTLTSLYLEQNFKAKFLSNSQTSQWLSQELADLKKQFESSQQALADYQKQNNILAPDEKQNIVTTKLDQINKDLTTAEGDRIQKEVHYRLALSGNPELIASAEISGLMQKLRAQESDLKTQYAQATTTLGPAHPRVQELDNQLKEIQSTIQAESRKLAGRYTSEYRAATWRERMLRKALAQQKEEANLLNEKAIQYNILKRDVESNRQLYEGLLQKFKEAAVSAGLRSNNIRVLDAARVPSRPFKPNLPRNLAVALLMGLMGAIGLAYILEMADKQKRNLKVCTPEHAHAISGLRAFGIIPKLDHARDRKRLKSGVPLLASDETVPEVVASYEPHASITECYRALRTSVLLSGNDAPPKVVLVTSALPQEGKTTTSLNLAAVFAQKGGRVLLVDADLRRPGIHKPFGIHDSSRGLSTLLTANHGLKDAIIPHPRLSNLSLLLAGPLPPQPAELLESPAMKDALRDWRTRYDHIVIDTPPVLSVTDPVLLATQADLVLLVVRLGETPSEALLQARDLLAQANARSTGVVINALDLGSSDYAYYAYGSAYSSKYYADQGTRRTAA